MTPLERAILALGQHEDAHSDQPMPEQYSSIEDIRRFPADYARHLAAARAVIEAIREPSESMVAAGETAPPNGASHPNDIEPGAAQMWPAMIDALLEEGR